MRPLTTRKVLALGIGIGGFIVVNVLALVAAFLLQPEGIAVLTTVVGADIVIIQAVINFYFNDPEDAPPPPAP